MLLTDGLRLTTTGYLKYMHKVALECGIKRREYTKPYYKVLPFQVNSLLRSGAVVVSTVELEEHIQCKLKTQRP